MNLVLNLFVYLYVSHTERNKQLRFKTCYFYQWSSNLATTGLKTFKMSIIK